MRKIYILILTSLISLNCKERSVLNTDLKPTYSEFENDWQVRNLFGKIKEIEFFKATYQNNQKEPKQNLVFIEKFTKFGSLKQKSNFDSFGEFFQKDVYEFNGKLLTRNISSDKYGNENYNLIIETDTIKKVTTNKWFKNDSLETTMKLFYNEKDYLTKKVVFEHNDTITTSKEYEFDQTKKVVLERQISNQTKDTIQTDKYKYDSNGNLIKIINEMRRLTLILETEWKNDRIYKRAEYTISADLKKHLNEITEYDKLFNPINSKVFENSELNRELKYDYEFDQSGNWIKRNVSIKEHFKNSNKFTPIYIESRNIKYWN